MSRIKKKNNYRQFGGGKAVSNTNSGRLILVIKYTKLWPISLVFRGSKGVSHRF